jgi:hypothetical protein
MKKEQIIFNIDKEYKDKLQKIVYMIGIEKNKHYTLTQLILDTLIKEYQLDE